MVYVVNGVFASGVDMDLEKDFVGLALQEMRIHPLMLLIQTLSMISQTFSSTLHNPSTRHTHASYVETILTMYSVEDMVSNPKWCPRLIHIRSDSDCDLPSCDDFSSIDVPRGNSMTFSNPLFDSNDDFTSSDDESLPDKDVPEDNMKIYSKPLFELMTKLFSSDVISSFDDGVKGHREQRTCGDVDEIELLLHVIVYSQDKLDSILEGFGWKPLLE
ncbi:hypothetical protein Tco_1071161 [Tanacetum coccineum]|uniref:Uncharacterized protein n=1 Tax=Tanacetum coccineum TaxID=301880 RepID=A0ABQ5HPV4_9ASTR